MPLVPGSNEQEARTRRKRGALWVVVPLLLPLLLLGGVLLSAYSQLLVVNPGRYELVCGQSGPANMYLLTNHIGTGRIRWKGVWSLSAGPLTCYCLWRETEVPGVAPR